jgi:methionine-rich copper-binding protein CopC
MKNRQVSAGRLVVLLLALAFSALPVVVASAHEMMVARSDPADGTTVAASPTHIMAQFGAEFNTIGGSTILMIEALAGVLVVLGLGEALRRRCR